MRQVGAALIRAILVAALAGCAQQPRTQVSERFDGVTYVCDTPSAGSDTACLSIGDRLMDQYPSATRPLTVSIARLENAGSGCLITYSNSAGLLSQYTFLDC